MSVKKFLKRRLNAWLILLKLLFQIAGAQARLNAMFGPGVGDIFLDDVMCDGSELRLLDCASRPLGVHNCLHANDAGVICQPASSRKNLE